MTATKEIEVSLDKTGMVSVRVDGTLVKQLRCSEFTEVVFDNQITEQEIRYTFCDDSDQVLP